jgi:hypothetical protein
MQSAEGENEVVTPLVDTPATPEPTPDAGAQPDTPEPSPGTTEPEQQDDGPKSMAEAIAAVLEPDKEGDAEPEKPAAKPEPDKPATAEPVKEPEPKPGTPGAEEGDDPTDDEMKAMRPNARRGIVRLLSQRNAARRELAETRTNWDRDKTDASSFRDIAGFMQRSRLEAREVDFIFDIGAKLKSDDPAMLSQAAETLVTLTQNLLTRLGRTLPPELKAKVEAGEVTEELAREQAQAQARATLAEERAQRLQKDQQAQQRQQITGQQQQSILSAVAQWEAATRTSDPDWKLKAAALVQFSRGVVAEHGHFPRNAEEAVAFAKEAYANVNAFLKTTRPAPNSTRPAPASGQSGNRAALKPAASSFAEHMANTIRDLQANRASQ